MYYLGGEIVADYVTVSAKIPCRLKESLDLYGVKIDPVARRVLKEEVRRRALLKIKEGSRYLAENCGMYPTRELLGS